MMTENSQLVLAFLKKNYGKEFSKQQIAKELGIALSAVTGSMNSLIKKEVAVTTREEKVVDEEATETRKEKSHVVKYHTLTEKGLTYDPAEEDRKAEAEKLRKREEAKAAKTAAAKAAKNDM